MSPASIPSAPDPHEPDQPPPPRARPHRYASERGSGPAAAVPTSVLFCHPESDASDDEKIAAAIRALVAAYSSPGDPIALADPADGAEPGSQAAREHRDRLVETVLRLARGAVTEPPRAPLGEDPPDCDEDRPAAARESGAGLGPDQPPHTVAEPTTLPTADRAPGRHTDRFTLIICGCTSRPPDPGLMADWTPLLAPDGALIVLTHGNHQSGVRAAYSGSLARAAALVGMTLTDRLILAHRSPSTTPPRTRHTRRAVALGGHRRTHATACVFRPSTSSLEPRHA